MRVQGNTPLSIPISEVPKSRNLSAYCYFRTSPIKISRLTCTRRLTLGFLSFQNTGTPRLTHARSFLDLVLWDFVMGNDKKSHS
jgi:hypothetical protein